MFKIINKFVTKDFRSEYWVNYNLSDSSLNDSYFVVQLQDTMMAEIIPHEDIENHVGKRALILGTKALCDIFVGMYNTIKFVVYDEFPEPGTFETSLKKISGYAKLVNGELVFNCGDKSLEGVNTTIENELVANVERLCPMSKERDSEFAFRHNMYSDNFTLIWDSICRYMQTFNKRLDETVQSYMGAEYSNIKNEDAVALRFLCNSIEQFRLVNFEQFFRQPVSDMKGNEVKKSNFFSK